MNELKEQVVKLSDAPLKSAIDSNTSFVAIVGNQVSRIPNELLPFLTEQQIQDIASITNKANKSIEKTYADLLALKGSFVIGQQYIITDYKTVYEQPVSGETMEGETERLLVRASSLDELEPICFSLDNPTDIIYYSLENTDFGALYGRITRRIDVSVNIDVQEDWKAIKYRRWELNVTEEWVQGNDYVVGDIVTTGSDIHYCIKDDTDSGDLYENWGQYPFDNGDFASLYSTGQPIYINGNKYFIPVSENYEDRTIFGENCRDITIGYNSQLMNNVFGTGNYYWTVGSANYSWTVGTGNNYWTVGNENPYWTVGNDIDLSEKTLPTNLNEYKDKKIYYANGITIVEYTDEFSDKIILEL